MSCFDFTFYLQGLLFTGIPIAATDTLVPEFKKLFKNYILTR